MENLWKITRIDESEATVEFGNAIVISYEDKSAFLKEFQDLIAKYAI